LKTTQIGSLSRRKRGLTGVDVRDTPTWDIELNSSFENTIDRLPLPEVEGTDRGVLLSYADLIYRVELRF
jgi:hypothetical protein